MDKFTETTTTSYGANIGNSIKGMGIGAFLIISSISLLWWNEGNTVAQASALSEMEANTITLSGTNYDAASEGKPVLIQGDIKPNKQLSDPLFGVISDGLLLKRDAQMYQWNEEEHTQTDNTGGSTTTTTTYSYNKKWASTPIDSSRFKHPEGHQNPQMTYQSQKFGTDATLGDYAVGQNMLSSLDAKSPIDLSKLPQYMNGFKNYNTYYYSGYNISYPKIGDMKISYSFEPVGKFTVAALSQNKELIAYSASNGRSLAFVKNGTMTAAQLFKAEQDANAMMAWFIRVIGLVIMYIGFTLLMGVLPTLARIIPFLGSLIGGVTGLIAAVLTLVVGSLVIAIAWFASRPMLSVALIAGGIVLAVILGKAAKRKAPSLTEEQ